MGTNETTPLINNGNNNQDSSLRERVSKYLLPVMVVVIALVVTALTATVATSITMATYKRCYQNLASCTVNVSSCITPSFNYNMSVSHNYASRRSRTRDTVIYYKSANSKRIVTIPECILWAIIIFICQFYAFRITTIRTYAANTKQSTIMSRMPMSQLFYKEVAREVMQMCSAGARLPCSCGLSPSTTEL